MNKENIKKVVLAYSGGLDTSIIIPWLKENYNNCEVIAVSGNVGQADELDGLEEKALKTGASKLYVLDLTEEYVDEYIMPCLKAGAVYEEYLLGTSHARPCIAKGLVDIALKEGADAICHGLGPDLPWVDEPSPGNLGHSTASFLTSLSLLIPAFSLVSCPPFLTVRLRPLYDAPLPIY